MTISGVIFISEDKLKVLIHFEQILECFGAIFLYLYNLLCFKIYVNTKDWIYIKLVLLRLTIPARTLKGSIIYNYVFKPI